MTNEDGVTGSPMGARSAVGGWGPVASKLRPAAWVALTLPRLRRSLPLPVGEGHYASAGIRLSVPRAATTQR